MTVAAQTEHDFWSFLYFRPFLPLISITSPPSDASCVPIASPESNKRVFAKGDQPIHFRPNPGPLLCASGRSSHPAPRPSGDRSAVRPDPQLRPFFLLPGGLSPASLCPVPLRGSAKGNLRHPPAAAPPPCLVQPGGKLTLEGGHLVTSDAPRRRRRGVGGCADCLKVGDSGDAESSRDRAERPPSGGEGEGRGEEH